MGWLTFGTAALAVGFAMRPRWRTNAFALWVLAFVLAALWHPDWFKQYGDWKGMQLISPLLQIAMFGMGATLRVADFMRVLRMPRAVLIGTFLQYAIMPALGFLIAYGLQLPPEVAAGVILVGSSPGGVSSNVVTYLARGHVALSVTLTAISTLLSPVMTPLCMKFYAGRIIEVPFFNMMLSIMQIVIVPLLLGLVANHLLRRFRIQPHRLERPLSWLSMLAICLICAIIVADARQLMITSGSVMLLAVALHNASGFVLGYWGARLLGLEENVRRTVSIEVGMQNGGMAAALAANVLQSSGAALAPALFGPWMNFTGGVLTAFWRARVPTTHRLTPQDLAGTPRLQGER
jgi:BASS family bile acid:Na+ symporter